MGTVLPIQSDGFHFELFPRKYQIQWRQSFYPRQRTFFAQGIQYLQQYIPTANEEYAAQVKLEHRREIAQSRAELERRVREQEARTKILQKVQI